MPRTITHDGRRIVIPDDATADKIIDILTRETAPLPAAPLPDVSSAERRPELALRTAQSAPSRSGMFDDLIPPPPPGFVLDQPTARSPAAPQAAPGVVAPPASPAPGAQPAAPQIQEGATAVNPQTGETLVYRGGQWTR